MKELFSDIRGAVMSTLVLAVVCCGIYPLIVFGIAQAAFHDKANGSLIVEKDGTVRGSKLLGQNFTAEKYFHPRPSAAGNGYDAANSSGSNLNGAITHSQRGSSARHIHQPAQCGTSNRPCGQSSQSR